MNMSIRRMRYLLAALVVLGIGLLPAIGLAQQNQDEQPAGQALEISPPRIALEADPGETVTVQVNIRNISDVQTRVQGRVVDFGPGGETGQPQFFFDTPAEELPNSLSQYIASVPSLTLEPRELREVSVDIVLPEDAEPGGHYGLIEFKPQSASEAGDGANVAITGSTGPLVLLNVSGDVNRQVSVEEFAAVETVADGTTTNANGEQVPQYAFGTEPKDVFENGPVGLTLRLNNTGNVHVLPTGSIKIKNTFGVQTAEVQFNESEGYSLPNAIRAYQTAIDDGVLFGRYTAEANLGFNGETLTAETNFWVLPWKLIAIALLVLIVLILLLTKGIKSYNRRIIAKAQGGSNSRKQQPPAGFGQGNDGGQPPYRR